MWKIPSMNKTKQLTFPFASLKKCSLLPLRMHQQRNFFSLLIRLTQPCININLLLSAIVDGDLNLFSTFWIAIEQMEGCNNVIETDPSLMIRITTLLNVYNCVVAHDLIIRLIDLYTVLYYLSILNNIYWWMWRWTSIK